MAAAPPVTGPPPRLTVKVCGTCGRFRRYNPDDQYCVVCGYDTLAAACDCGRAFDYALDEPEGGGLHCPRCGKDWRGPRHEH